MTVYLVDDEASVRRALGRLFRAEGFRVIDFASPGEFLRAEKSEPLACIVLDMAMPEMDGLAVQQALLEAGNLLPIIFLTGRADVPMCAQAMKRGAFDFLVKPANDVDLLDAVRRAMAHGLAAREEAAELEDIRSRIAALTPREHEVMMLVVAGRLNKQIAGDLGAAEKTIKVHRGRVMEKMGAESLAELVRMAGRISH